MTLYKSVLMTLVILLSYMSYVIIQRFLWFRLKDKIIDKQFEFEYTKNLGFQYVT